MASCGTLTVEEETTNGGGGGGTTFDPSMVSITSCSVPGSVASGGSITLTASVSNQNSTSATFELAWVTDTGAELGRIAGLTLAGGSSDTFSTTLSYADVTSIIGAGTSYSLTVELRNVSESANGGTGGNGEFENMAPQKRRVNRGGL